MPKDRKGHGSSPRITPRVNRLIEVLVQGQAGSVDKAAELSGLAKRSVYAALAKPHVQAEIERRARRKLRGFALPRALSVMTDLLAAESEYVKADIAKHIGAIHGVKPVADGTPGAGGGFVVRIVVNGQTVDVGAAALPGGAPGVQTIEHRPGPQAIPGFAGEAHDVEKVVRDDQGAGDG